VNDARSPERTKCQTEPAPGGHSFEGLPAQLCLSYQFGLAELMAAVGGVVVVHEGPFVTSHDVPSDRLAASVMFPRS
jgi:hypothetical protein